MALTVLEETASRSRHAPQPQTRGLALALALLASEARTKDRKPFDDFWRLLLLDDSNSRAALVGARLTEIYQAVGQDRAEAVRQAFEQMALAELGLPSTLSFREPRP